MWLFSFFSFRQPSLGSDLDLNIIAVAMIHIFHILSLATTDTDTG